MRAAWMHRNNHAANISEIPRIIILILIISLQILNLNFNNLLDLASLSTVTVISASRNSFQK